MTDQPTGHVAAADLSEEDRSVLAQNWAEASTALGQILALNRVHRDVGCADWFCTNAELSDLLDGYEPHQLQMILRVAVERLTEVAQERDERRDEAVELLADLVAKCTEYGTQDGGFVASYLLPTGPVHRAIPWLEQRGITVRPGFDGRTARDDAPGLVAAIDSLNDAIAELPGATSGRGGEEQG